MRRPLNLPRRRTVRNTRPRLHIRDEKSGWKVAGPPPPLSVATAESLLAGWRGRRGVEDVRPLDGGLMNRNYRIRLAGSRDAFVLRFFDRDPAACVKEAAVLALVRDNVPVADVVHVEANGAEGFPPYLVLEFIDGISLRELKRRGDLDALGEAALDAGQVLARLTRHRFDRSGLLTPALAIDSSTFDGVTIFGLVDHFAQAPAFQRRVDTDLRRRVDVWARASQTLFGDLSAPSLVHGDFNSANILVREEGGHWSVAAILDWEFAFAGSFFCDVGNLLRYERADRPRFEPHFSRGCVDGGLSLPDDWHQRARFADLTALCELLARDDLPDPVVDEVRDLISATVSRST
jgi:aminoglycoside phosphotransferase (APT) family kinase protein